MSPSDIIALVSVIAGSVVGATGVLAAWWAASQDRGAARSLAEDERRQSRLGDAYVDLLDLVERTGYWASQLRPITAGSDYEPPEPPSVAEQTRVRAKLAAYGSAEARSRHKTWLNCVQQIMTANHQVILRQQAARENEGYRAAPGEDVSWRNPTEPWIKIHQEYLPAETTAREALIEQVAVELA